MKETKICSPLKFFDSLVYLVSSESKWQHFMDFTFDLGSLLVKDFVCGFPMVLYLWSFKRSSSAFLAFLYIKLSFLFSLEFNIIICHFYLHSFLFCIFYFVELNWTLISLQHKIEKLMESCSKKKAEIQSMLETTSQVKQLKETLSQSMSLVCLSFTLTTFRQIPFNNV